MTNKVYINGLGCVSPQRTSDFRLFREGPVTVVGNRLKAIDPNYKDFIPSDMIRRMGRIIKMGVAAAKMCLADSRHQAVQGQPGIPEKIITGTGLGCIEDTEKFLSSMIRNREEFLTPTSFIQSTHNTVSAQIAILLKCHGYNFTYVHRGFSFETALLDCLMQLDTRSPGNILLGCADELTDHSFQIQHRLGFWKRNPVNNLELFASPGHGTIAGEGAAFFFLETTRQSNTYAAFIDCAMLLRPVNQYDIHPWILRFLERTQLSPRDIDLIITGKNGDPQGDARYHHVLSDLFPDTHSASFKHLCGEYHTATGFASWLGAQILREQAVPASALPSGDPMNINTILIYNHFHDINHSLILLSRP